MAPKASSGGSADSVELEAFLAWVLTQNNVNPAGFRGSALNRRLPACLRFLRVPTPEAARRLLECRPDLLPATLAAVLIGVTEFFREKRVFDDLSSLVLPSLRRQAGRLQVAGFGVSRGHELYSAAIQLAEHGLLARSELMGLDCRANAICAAAAARFSATDLEGLSPERVARFFVREDVGYAARPELKQNMRWRVGDLFSFQTAERFHLVFFRNVAIYLTAEGARQAWEIICRHVRPGGFVVTGKAERPPPQLPLRRIAPCIYIRRES